MPDLKELIVRLRADADPLKKGFNDATTSAKKFGQNMTSAGKTLTVGLTTPIVGMGVASLISSTQFNTAMANVASLLPGNVARVNQLKTTVQDMSIQFGTNTNDMAAGLYQLLSAFGDDAQTAKRLAIETKAAKGGVASVTDAINLTSAVTKAYGDTSAVAVQHASDLALLTVRLGQTTFPELAGSIGQVTALSSNLNISQEQLFATFSSTSGVIGTSAQVATDMKGAMQALLAPTSSMSDLFKKVGVSSGQALIKQYGFAGAMKKIVDYAKQTHQPLQKLIGSVEGQTLALSLAGPQGKAFADNLKQMQNASGTTDQAFRDQTQGVNKTGFAWAQAQAKLQVFMQQLGDRLGPILIQILNFISPLLSAFGQMSPVLQIGVIVVGALAAALGPLLLIVGQVAGAIAAFSAGGALAFLTPFIPIIAAVVGALIALGAAIALIVTHWQQISQAITSNPVFQFLATKIFPVLVKAFQDLGNTVRSQVKPILTQLGTTLHTQLLPAWQRIQAALNAAKPVFAVIGAVVGGILLVSLGLLIGILKGVFSALGPILSGVIQVFGGIAQVISGVVQVIVGIFQILIGIVKGIFTGDWTTLGDGLKNLKDGVLNILGGLWTAVVGIFKGLVGGVVGLVSGLVSGVIGFFKGLWEKIVGHSIIPDLVNGVLKWIENLEAKFLTFIGSLVSRAIAFFVNLGVKILLAVNNFVNLVLAFVDHWKAEMNVRISALVALVSAVFHRVIDVITSPFKSAKKTVMGIIDDIKGFFSGLHLSLPQIHLPAMPHFSISGSFSLKPPSVPHLDVKWYGTGGIFTSPQIVGLGDRPEAVIPLDRLPGMVPGAAGGASGSGQPVVFEVDGRAFARAVLPHIVDAIRNPTGVRSL